MSSAVPLRTRSCSPAIRALIRRSSPAAGDVLVAGDLVIDRPTRRVRIRDVSVDLSAKEFELVAKLASEPYRVFTKEELLREVWGYRALGRTRTLESHASRVRKKLCVDAADAFVVNVWGVPRAVAGGVGRSSEVAWLLRFAASPRSRSPSHSEAFGDFAGTLGERTRQSPSTAGVLWEGEPGEVRRVGSCKRSTRMRPVRREPIGEL